MRQDTKSRQFAPIKGWNTYQHNSMFFVSNMGSIHYSPWLISLNKTKYLREETKPSSKGLDLWLFLATVPIFFGQDL
jgi:hypothetical protein